MWGISTPARIGETLLSIQGKISCSTIGPLWHKPFIPIDQREKLLPDTSSPLVHHFHSICKQKDVSVPPTGSISQPRGKSLHLLLELRNFWGFVVSFKLFASLTEATAALCVLAPAKSTQISNLPATEYINLIFLHFLSMYC